MKPEQEAPSREPWAQLPRMPGQRRETDVAYAAFQVYYRLPPGERSARLTAIKVGKSKKLIEDWSRFHHWVERAKAWDDHLARIADQQLEQKAREEAEKWAKRR